IYPVAVETIQKKDWQAMHLQSFDLPFTFIDTPKKPDIIIKEGSWQKECSFKTETGEVSMDQLELIFANLPVEMTMIDENDKVVFFSDSENRIFPRSSAIIGRDVQNCHPPESVHIVNEIIETFKKGTKQKAEFWFKFKEKFIFTVYHALHDKEGIYKGILEVSQDISRFKNLEGERRLLNWE
ncbi:MAG: PAS domain-containing protein, partial [Spirochaetota bacterium]|nr:PAS domain-containing protein [Spirochaetota bacterium]